MSRLQTESNTNNHLKIGLSLYQQTACGSHGNLNSTNYVVFVLFSSRFLPLSPQSCAMCEVTSQTKTTPLPIFPCGETGTLLNHSSLPFFTSFSLAFSSLLLLHLYFLLCEENISSPVFFFIHPAASDRSEILRNCSNSPFVCELARREGGGQPRG